MILVDDIKYYRSYTGNFKQWCHMTSDASEAELHEFAEKLGLKRRWFQDHSTPHYDLVPTKRAAAVRRGAEQVTSEMLIKRCYKREEQVAQP